MKYTKMPSTKSTNEQLQIIKNMIKNCNNKDIMQSLCYAYLDRPLNHPIRELIARFLRSRDVNRLSIVMDILSRSIYKYIIQSEAELNTLTLNNVIVSISDCFHNFLYELRFFRHEDHAILSIGELSLKICLKNILSLNMLSTQYEQFSYIDNSLSFLSYYIQNYRNLPHILNYEFDAIKCYCKQMAIDNNFPLNIRVSAASLLTCITKVNGIPVMSILDTQNKHNTSNIILCIGILKSVKKCEFYKCATMMHTIIKMVDAATKPIAMVPGIVLWVLHGFCHISLIILENRSAYCQNVDIIKSILCIFLNFSLISVECDVDVVRYIARDVLLNVITILHNFKFKYLLNKLYNISNLNHISITLRCILLQKLCTIVGVQAVLTNCPCVFTEIFPRYLGKHRFVNNLYQCLMLASHKILNFNDWCHQWVTYLLSLMQIQDSRLPNLEDLLTMSIKIDKAVLNYLFESCVWDKIPMHTKLLVSKMVQKNQLKSNNFYKIFEDILAVLKFLIFSHCEKTRHMALYTLVETIKSADSMNTVQSSLIKLYIQYCLNVETACVRQQNIILLKDAFEKCGLMLQKQCNNIANGIMENNFLNEVIEILINNITSDANFNRRMASMQILEICVRIDSKYNLNIKSLSTNYAMEVIIRTLNDPYDLIKDVALSILQLMSAWKDKYEKYLNMDTIKTLLQSKTVSETITGAYQFLLLYESRSVAIVDNIRYPPMECKNYAALIWLLNELQKGFNIAQISLSRASETNPLYGILFAIRRIVDNINFSIVLNDSLWQDIIIELISLCKKISILVSPVINDLSPEGYLPSDSILAVSPKSKMSQLILMCAWRTTKEISLILGNIVFKIPSQLKQFPKQCQLNEDEIINIGVHMQRMLLGAKHRGAFEQTYIGFHKLCNYLYTTKHVRLNSLPLKWIEMVLSIISESSSTSAKFTCTTRRGAGIPFIIQAIVVSESKYSTGHVCLHNCMRKLLEISSCRDTTIECRTHSLNIMRTLFRCADLREATCEFISNGVIAAVNSFGYTNWKEKNSAALLFATLMSRIFGNNRAKNSDENADMEMKMSDRLFFTNYPTLYEFILKELQIFQCTPRLTYPLNDTVHLLLLIVKRLYPTGVEENNINSRLSKFVPHIMAIHTSPKLRIRLLSSKLISTLIDDDHAKVMIMHKCCKIKTSVPQMNEIHGHLLIIRFLIKHHSAVIDESMIIHISALLVNYCKESKWKNSVVFETILHIFISLIKSAICLNVDATTVRDLHYFSSVTIHDQANTKIYPVVNSTYLVYKLYSNYATGSIKLLVNYLVDVNCVIMKYLPFEHLKSWLNIILMVLVQNLPTNTFVESTYKSTYMHTLEICEISSIESEFVSNLNDGNLRLLATDIKHSEILKKQLIHFIRTTTHFGRITACTYTILSLLNTTELPLWKLLRILSTCPREYKCSVMLCVLNVIQKRNVTCKQMKYCLKNAWAYAQSYQLKYLRASTALILTVATEHFIEGVTKKYIDFVILYIRYILHFLSDDDADIRDYIVRVILLKFCDHAQLKWKAYSINATISYSLNTIAKKCSCIVPCVAHNLFIQSVINVFIAQNIGDNEIIKIFECIITHLLSQKGHKTIQSVYDINDYELSERNMEKINTEPQKMVSDIFEIFSTSFATNIKLINFINNYRNITFLHMKE